LVENSNIDTARSFQAKLTVGVGSGQATGTSLSTLAAGHSKTLGYSMYVFHHKWNWITTNLWTDFSSCVDVCSCGVDGSVHKRGLNRDPFRSISILSQPPL